MPEHKSTKQRRAELKEQKAKRSAKALKKFREGVRAFAISKIAPSAVVVNTDALAADNSYSVRDFVERGYYVDVHYACKDCGKEEIWCATHQKWWYEVAKGGRWTTANRCGPCRRKERERAAEHRRVSEEGKARKQALKAAKV